jgi:YHS domain-containing protein
MAIDPACGVKEDEASALSAKRDGTTACFCSDDCRQKFLSGVVPVFQSAAQPNHCRRRDEPVFRPGDR